MTAVRSKMRMLFACRRGATAIEYGLIAALIIITMLTGLRTLGGGAGGMWTNVANNVINADAP